MFRIIQICQRILRRLLYIIITRSILRKCLTTPNQSTACAKTSEAFQPPPKSNPSAPKHPNPPPKNQFSLKFTTNFYKNNQFQMSKNPTCLSKTRKYSKVFLREIPQWVAAAAWILVPVYLRVTFLMMTRDIMSL